MTDWAPGDLALCVKVGAWKGDAPGSEEPYWRDPQPGHHYTVARVIPDNSGKPYLILCELHWLDSFAAYRFVKITPEAADEFDRETIAIMRGDKTPQLTEPERMDSPSSTAFDSGSGGTPSAGAAPCFNSFHSPEVDHA